MWCQSLTCRIARLFAARCLVWWHIRVSRLEQICCKKPNMRSNMRSYFWSGHSQKNSGETLSTYLTARNCECAVRCPISGPHRIFDLSSFSKYAPISYWIPSWLPSPLVAAFFPLIPSLPRPGDTRLIIVTPSLEGCLCQKWNLIFTSSFYP